MIRVVFIRHGQTSWNKKGLFTGWTDVDLTKRGKEEAMSAGRKLKKADFTFDLAFTSFLRRTKSTLKLILQEMDIKRPEVVSDWRLNERHYGDLVGKNKQMMVEKFGFEKVLLWRRGYDVLPPPISKTNPFYRNHIPRYKKIKIPLAESMKNVEERMVDFWEDKIVPNLRRDKKIIISTSGNSLRALIRYFDKLHVKELMNLNVPTGIPLVYEFDDKLRPKRRYYLASREELAAATQRVKNQIKK